jgi:hypothetical protein
MSERHATFGKITRVILLWGGGGVGGIHGSQRGKDFLGDHNDFLDFFLVTSIKVLFANS